MAVILYCIELIVIFFLLGFVCMESVMARKMLNDGEMNKPSEEEEHYDFDLFVIGAGSGGVRAARFSAQYGAKVYSKDAVHLYMMCLLFIHDIFKNLKGKSSSYLLAEKWCVFSFYYLWWNNGGHKQYTTILCVHFVSLQD